MPVQSLVSAQTSKVQVSVDVITVGRAVVIRNASLLPRLGQSQTIRLRLVVSGPTEETDMEIDVALFDKAFEEFGLHGESTKKPGDRRV